LNANVVNARSLQRRDGKGDALLLDRGHISDEHPERRLVFYLFNKLVTFNPRPLSTGVRVGND
jgi:hypothetical protein